MLRIDGERIYLRDHQALDLSAFHSWISNPAVMKYLSWRTSTIEESFLQLAECIKESQKENRTKYYLAIVLRQSEQIIGETGVTVEVRESEGGIANMGYFLLEPYWGNGYATEAARLMIDYCFTTLKLHKVTAGCDAENTASEMVMKRCGMAQEAFKRQHCYLGGQWRDRLEYGIVRQDWSEHKVEEAG